MSNFQDEELKETNEAPAEEQVAADVETQEEADAPKEEQPFDESQLLELAKNEGLIDATPEEEAASSDPAAPIDLPEEEQAQIMASIETILFMSDKPVSLPKLRQTINSDIPLKVYRVLMARLREEFNRDHRGVEIGELSLGFQLRTKPQMASVLRKMVKTQPLKLSAVTMEVLAVCAYKQPVTKDEIDQIRGVDSGYVLRNLMEKRLVKIAGRSELPGKPMLYGTTHEFLELFNLKDVNSLPPLHEVEAMVAASEVGFEEKTQAVMEEFGKMVANNTKILFDDSQIDSELEALRAEIASIPTSTSFIDEQKAKEKYEAKLAELAAQGLTLDAEGKVVPIGSITEQPTVTTSSVVADTEVAIQVSAPIISENETSASLSEEHRPSPELEAAAAAAQMERHAAMIADTVAVVNAEAIADAVTEAKIESQLEAEEREPEL